MKTFCRTCALVGVSLLAACATSGEGWTGAGVPFGQAETACRQEAERVPASAQKRAFDTCMERAGWTRTKG